MESLIEKIQKEVDEANQKAEQRKKQEEDQKPPEPQFDKDRLISLDLSGIENAVKFILAKIDTIDADLDKWK